jgi:succinate dehydrogenase / fumarate reductase cytochrome b subunit
MPITNRPLSPFMQVYKPQLTSMMSISHRLMGLALSVGSLFFVWQLVAAASGPDEYDFFQSLAGSWIGLLMLVGWSFALFYHLANGIRHLVWDAGYGFGIEATYRSGYIVLIATVALTVIAWVSVLILWGGKS